MYLLISINWPSLVTSWVVVQKIYSKMHLVSCTDTHRDVTDLVNHEMVKNTKTWISSERNIIFLRNKEFLNLCSRWHILRSYCFVVEVTFKLYQASCSYFPSLFPLPWLSSFFSFSASLLFGTQHQLTHPPVKSSILPRRKMPIFQGVAPWYANSTLSFVIPLWDSRTVHSPSGKELDPSF